jgi:hypothetical protein
VAGPLISCSSPIEPRSFQRRMGSTTVGYRIGVSLHLALHADHHHPTDARRHTGGGHVPRARLQRDLRARR